MKKKHLIFCLLFLVLGTTIAWADKYYQPGSYRGNTTPRLTLAQAVGKKFMIYNTAVAGNEDRTGFLRNNGVQFEHDKTKERDLFIYNESFVYTMEAHHDDQDGNPDWYAIKSVETGLYVNASGRTDIGSAADAKLYITDWDNATGKSGVNMESWKYNIVANGQITSGGHGSTVFVVKNGNTYWNGLADEFITWSDGLPFAFYVANEYTNDGDYDFLTDLHIYSRCDIYSAQVIYGYIRNAGQITSNHTYEIEGSLANLLDGDATTYNVTDWRVSNEGDDHYYQVDLGTSVSSLYLYMQRRADGKNAPIKYELQACATADGQYTSIDEYTTNLGDSAVYLSPKIDLNGSYQYIRIVAKERSTDGYKCVGLSELYVLPGTQTIAEAFEFVKMVESDPLYTKATARVYNDLIEEYNDKCPDAKLLSGVPLPGNKYRIYADAYDVDNHVYVNREIMAGNGLEIKDPGSYHSVSGDEQKKYEWYCELTADGYYIFRNVLNLQKYLGNGTVTDEPYKWTMSTLGTHRFGVPLMNIAQQYLAMENTGGHWMGNVRETQDQTVAPVSVDHDNNQETEAEVVEKGLCTDFVFIPVPLAGEEKKITITGNELVERNTKLLFDANNDGTAEEHALPFTRMFVSKDRFESIRLQLLCNDVHEYQGIRVNDAESLATDIATNNSNVLSFNWEKVENDDVLNIELNIKKPFEVMPAKFSTTETPTLYYIKNKKGKQLAQQALPYQPFALNAAGIDIEIEDDGPISTQTGADLYARFDNRNAVMSIVTENLDAHSLFYFTETEDKNTTEYYSVNINNATTVMKCADNATWNTNGNTWFVQPKKAGNYTGYNIGRDILTATNNPDRVWKLNDENTSITIGTANADNTAWEFVPVPVDSAKAKLYRFIKGVVKDLNRKLDGKIGTPGLDDEIIGYYKDIVGMMEDRATYFSDEEYNGNFSDEESDHLAKLLQFAQNIHMIEHEIEYALQALPELSQEPEPGEERDPKATHWYYIRNVNSDNRYAAHNGNGNPMSLEQYADAGTPKKLANMFYLVGEKNSYAPVVDTDPNNNGLYKDFPGNNLIIDEYLKAHIHNFQSRGTTLVSKNVQLNIITDSFPGAGQQTVMDSLSLKHDEDWSIELEYELSGNTSFNAYGSSLLASSGEPLADSYQNGFQVYLKDDRSIVVKVGNNDDRYRFWHTQDYYSHIKVVITYSQKKVVVDVYNSNGEKESMTITGVTLNDIDKLSTALPSEGAKITSLGTYQVEQMTWKTHEEVVGIENKDEWYILPSSNVNRPGLAIVLGEPNDNKMGWANGEGSNTYVATDLGTADNSTWVFERITEFDAHVDELLGSYNLEDCVIYDPDLADLLGLIARNKALIYEKNGDEEEEALFNELYYSILDYTGAMPDDLKAPKPGSLYTIRPAADAATEKALLVHVDKQNTYYSTKEVYNGEAKRDDGTYDTRAIWAFEGTADGDFLALNGLNVKNLHTQCYLNAPGADATVVNESGAAAVTLEPLGGCLAAFKVGDNSMSSTGNNTVLYKVESQPSKNTGFWGYAVTNYPTELNDVIGNAQINANNGAVHCKSLSVIVENEGDVTVTLTYTDGDHKLNILGVNLVDANGNVVKTDYRYLFAGGNKQPQTYTLAGVTPGTYTINCYVWNYTSSYNDDQVNRSGGKIEITNVSSVALITNEATDDTKKWIIEEIKNPKDNVYFVTSTNTNGHSTLMLGFPTTIPSDVVAFHGVADGKILTGRYISLESYDGILPANAPVILRNYDETIEPKEVRFYYTTETPEKVNDSYIKGYLYFNVVDCRQFGDVDVYMMNKNRETTRMYLTYQNYDAKGNKVTIDGTTSHFESGHVTSKANKAFMVLPKETTSSVASLAFTFGIGGGTTDIDEVETELEVIETIFDLQGRRVTEITQPGIYIINGKKVIVK